MPSRRTLLSTASTAAVGAVAGCTVASSDRSVDGYVQLKSIEAWKRDPDGEELSKDVIIRVWPKSRPGPREPELKILDDEWADRFDTPLEPVVSDELHDDLDRTYETLQYTVGVCSEEWIDKYDDGNEIVCHNASVSREEFNTAQLYDHVRASYENHELSIHSREGEWTFDSE
ncbi:hypothetical protein [Natrinema versiforme]|uniref:Uncharacterized protein n=1 Tax=Natrinema versiforme TaxID=88724 RepID=A0A4P8WH30_9EURY|nr:hypothetical protein [Natrinema versiforme]QCS42688.1 hypothetical protein FEJ81_10075 [Natrinema versiforme]